MTHPSKTPMTTRKPPPGLPRSSPNLTYERASELLKYDPESGALMWRNSGTGRRRNRLAGHKGEKYREVCVDGQNYKAHRLAYLLKTGRWPADLIDHRDGDGHNNAWKNLRPANHQQNARNKRASKASKTGILGVSPVGDKFQADIGVNGKNIHLGRFECVEAAAHARCKAERHFFGDFAKQIAKYPIHDSEKDRGND